MIAFRVNGLPAPKGSYKIVGRGRKSRLIADSRKTNPWQAAVGWAARIAMRGTVPIVRTALRIDVAFYLPRPGKPMGPRPMVKPDGDKLLRATLDPMEGIVFDNDSRVVSMHVEKFYATAAEPAGAHITITEAA